MEGSGVERDVEKVAEGHMVPTMLMVRKMMILRETKMVKNQKSHPKYGNAKQAKQVKTIQPLE